MTVHANVIEELAIPENGAACAGQAAGDGWVLHEPLQHWQGIGQALVYDDRTWYWGEFFGSS